MNASKANLINSISLIALGLWGFFEAFAEVEWKAATALIPVVFGLILFFCTKGIKNQNKMIAHVAVLLTLLILFALLGMRLPKVIDAGGVDLYRIIAMCLTSVLAVIYFVRSFIEARRK